MARKEARHFNWDLSPISHERRVSGLDRNMKGKLGRQVPANGLKGVTSLKAAQ